MTINLHVFIADLLINKVFIPGVKKQNPLPHLYPAPPTPPNPPNSISQGYPGYTEWLNIDKILICLNTE